MPNSLVNLKYQKLPYWYLKLVLGIKIANFFLPLTDEVWLFNNLNLFKRQSNPFCFLDYIRLTG